MQMRESQERKQIQFESDLKKILLHLSHSLGQKKQI